MSQLHSRSASSMESATNAVGTKPAHVFEHDADLLHLVLGIVGGHEAVDGFVRQGDLRMRRKIKQQTLNERRRLHRQNKVA